MEVEQKESVLQAKPDDALFVVDAVGERELETEAEAAACGWSTSHVHHISLCVCCVCCVVFTRRRHDCWSIAGSWQSLETPVSSLEWNRDQSQYCCSGLATRVASRPVLCISDL